jgi:hypothetical protein
MQAVMPVVAAVAEAVTDNYTIGNGVLIINLQIINLLYH